MCRWDAGSIGKAMTDRGSSSNAGSTKVALAGNAPARGRLLLAADALVAAVAVSLPWSTSATGILIALWLIALLPIGPAAVWRELMTAAGGLPVLLWALGAIGMLWADVSWSE